MDVEALPVVVTNYCLHSADTVETWEDVDFHRLDDRHRVATSLVDRLSPFPVDDDNA